MDRKEEIKDEVSNWDKDEIEELAQDLLSLVESVEQEEVQ